MNTFRGIQTVRVGLWAALQIMLLLFVFPELGVYRSEEQQICMCFEASCFSLVSIVIVVPMFPKASPFARVVLVLMLAFPVWIFYGVLRIRGFI